MGSIKLSRKLVKVKNIIDRLFLQNKKEGLGMRITNFFNKHEKNLDPVPNNYSNKNLNNFSDTSNLIKNTTKPTRKKKIKEKIPKKDESIGRKKHANDWSIYTILRKRDMQKERNPYIPDITEDITDSSIPRQDKVDEQKKRKGINETEDLPDIEKYPEYSDDVEEEKTPPNEFDIIKRYHDSLVGYGLTLF